jgi:hypothetical protein
MHLPWPVLAFSETEIRTHHRFVERAIRMITIAIREHRRPRALSRRATRGLVLNEVAGVYSLYHNAVLSHSGTWKEPPHELFALLTK